MPKQEQHTLVRISLRSMLGLTFGVALVMAVAGPYIKDLDADYKSYLLLTLVSLLSGMAIGTILVIRERKNIGQKSGPLLSSLAMPQERNKKWLRWFWLLLLLPFFVLMQLSNVASTLQLSPSLFNYVSLLWLPVCYSMFLTKFGLAMWAEGYSSVIEFCEHGIAHTQKFYAWSSPAIRSMYWTQNSEKLFININRMPVTIPVPLEQREGVEAILQHYYRPAKDQK